MGSENVGMSNRNSVENTEHQKPKVSLAMIISQGLGGPNFSPEVVRGMDNRLIFLFFHSFPNSDAVVQFRRIIGFSYSVFGQGLWTNQLPGKAGRAK